jgi:DNA-binding LytR/AlgR family response regulator
MRKGVPAMLRFAVCDDDRVFCDFLKDKIYDYANLHKLDLMVEVYLSGHELLKSDSKYDIVFMDYILDDLDGLQTARKLRETDDNCTIIFTTSSLDAGPESMEIGSFRYLCILTTKAVLAMLPKDDFCRVSKGYAVNFTHISNRSRDCIHFKSGESVPISRFYHKSFISAYLRYTNATMPL